MLEESDNLVNLYELSIADFSKELGSSSPAPGGGSTAALAGALSCSLITMVCKITLKRSKEPKRNIRLNELLTDAENAQERFLNLINDDTNAFNQLMKSFKLPKDTDTELGLRTEAIQAATKHAAEVPLETAHLAVKVLYWTNELTDLGTRNAITDTGVAGLMAYSAFKGAIWNVKINLGSIQDSGFVQETNLELEQLSERVNHLRPELMNNVENKI